MKCLSPECTFTINKDAANNDGSHCCLSCMKTSGKTHGNKCEKTTDGPSIYTQNTTEVNAANGLATWKKAEIDAGLGLASHYRKTTKGKIITITGSAAEVQETYSKISGTKIPESETDTYQGTGNLIRFVDSSNKTLITWSEVTNSETNDTFYIVTTCSDPTKYDPVLVIKA